MRWSYLKTGYVKAWSALLLAWHVKIWKNIFTHTNLSVMLHTRNTSLFFLDIGKKNDCQNWKLNRLPASLSDMQKDIRTLLSVKHPGNMHHLIWISETGAGLVYNCILSGRLHTALLCLSYSDIGTQSGETTHAVTIPHPPTQFTARLYKAMWCEHMEQPIREVLTVGSDNLALKKHCN